MKDPFMCLSIYKYQLAIESVGNAGDAGGINLFQGCDAKGGTVSPFLASHGSTIFTALPKADKARDLAIAGN